MAKVTVHDYNRPESKNYRIRLESKFFNEVGEIPFPEYPRPQLERNSFLNLNGKWQFAMQKKAEEFKGYDKEILVPFSPESLLSGLDGKVAMPDDVLYYKRSFNLDKSFLKERTIIHFGAVDCECVVKINGEEACRHVGGFVPFSFEITNYVKEGENEIEVVVTDPSDTSYHSRGKQSLKNGGIWYTPQSGIWQTVWIESLPKDFIKDITIIPDIDSGEVTIKAAFDGEAGEFSAIAYDGGKEIGRAVSSSGKAVIKLDGFELWSPENPKLYDLIIEYREDKIKSYFGMRKFSIITDEKGKKRLALNNKPYFHNGVLDQGYWSDGMLTPPCDAAMKYDIKLMKDMGFNMLRKHIKIEPLRWYYHCDRLGMLVWQDMVSGGEKYNLLAIGGLAFIGIHPKDTKRNYKFFARQSKEGREEYYRELKTMINHLKNCVSLSVWVLFNEGWGQFDSVKATQMVREMDPTRIIDSVSGWNDQGKKTSDLKSLHIYFKPITLPRDKRVIVLSEFGGYSIKTEGHVFSPNKSFGYRIYKKPESFAMAYGRLFDKKIVPLIKKGLSATVYTQLSDVEEEINGFITYDRKVVKIPVEFVKQINDRLKY